MATTAGGSTYVVSTDLVADYPTSSLALANRVDVVASGGPVLVKTAGYTITVADILSGNKFLYNSASGGTFTFPTASLVDGMVIQVAQIGAGALTVSGGTIVGTTATTAQYQSLMFVYVASGTSWYSVAPPSTTPGLAIVTPTSIANSGGTATLSGAAVTYTGVNSVSLNGVFTSTYSNYRIVLRPTAVSANDIVISLRLRAAGTDASGTDYATQRTVSTSTSVTGAVSAAQTSGRLLFNTSVYGTYGAVTADIFGPQSASATLYTYTSHYLDNAGNKYVETAGGSHNLATSYDGLTLLPSSGTMTGTVRIYGYNNG